MADRKTFTAGTLDVTMVGSETTKEWLEEKPMRIRAAEAKAMHASTALVEGRTKYHLTNRVLNIRTSRLRNSIHRQVRGAMSRTIQGIVGTNVWYGKIHELGIGKAKERSFLRRALGEEESRILRIHRDRINEAVQEGQE